MSDQPCNHARMIAALDIFIKSGSANGDESMRHKCRDYIAALRACAEALRRFVVTTSDNQCATLPDGQRCRFVVCAVCDARAALAALAAVAQEQRGLAL